MALGPVWIDLASTTLSEEDKALLQHPNLGGVILFTRNYQSPEQIIALIQQIKRYRPECLIGCDQEGGRVQRFRAGLSRLPSLGVLGQRLNKTRDNLAIVTDIVQNLGQLMAMEMRALGIDISFAPVLDLDLQKCEVIGDRAFHSDPDIVSTLAWAYIQGMNKAGMSATGKHFPGHGGVSLDSHYALPVDEREIDELDKEMAPFSYLIQRGIHAIMPAHIVFSKIDNRSVGGSQYWLQKILRQKLGFCGAIISDDLSMKAAEVLGPPVQRAQLAIDAGCDIVLVCNNRNAARAVLTQVRLNYDQIHYKRIFALKGKDMALSWENLSQNKDYQLCRVVLEKIQTQE